MDGPLTEPASADVGCATAPRRWCERHDRDLAPAPAGIGAALTAFCFSLAGVHGSTCALWLGAGFAAFAAVASVMRLAVRQ